MTNSNFSFLVKYDLFCSFILLYTSLLPSLCFLTNYGLILASELLIHMWVVQFHLEIIDSTHRNVALWTQNLWIWLYTLGIVFKASLGRAIGRSKQKGLKLFFRTNKCIFHSLWLRAEKDGSKLRIFLEAICLLQYYLCCIWAM